MCDVRCQPWAFLRDIFSPRGQLARARLLEIARSSGRRHASDDVGRHLDQIRTVRLGCALARVPSVMMIATWGTTERSVVLLKSAGWR